MIKELLKLYCLFFKIGLFTFGGGLAMLPLLKAEIVDKRRFLTEDELTDLYSIGQCTPGIIVVNVVTFVGYRQLGVLGAVFSTLGAITPSIIIITAIASTLQQFMYNQYVTQAFVGIRLCVLALIASMIYDMAWRNIKGLYGIIVFIAALALLVGAHFSAIMIVITAAVSALIVGEVKRRIKKK